MLKTLLKTINSLFARCRLSLEKLHKFCKGIYYNQQMLFDQSFLIYQPQMIDV